MLPSDSMAANLAQVLKGCVTWATRGKTSIKAIVRDGTRTAATYSTQFNATITGNALSNLPGNDLIVTGVDFAAMTSTEISNVLSFLQNGGGALFSCIGWVWDAYSGRPFFELPANVMFTSIGITAHRYTYASGMASANKYPDASLNGYLSLQQAIAGGSNCANQALCVTYLQFASSVFADLATLVDESVFMTSPMYNDMSNAYNTICASTINAVTYPVDLTSARSACMKYLQSIRTILPFNANHPLVRFGITFPGSVAGYSASNITSRTRTVSTVRANWFSLGYYALPGTWINVTVPSSVLNKIQFRIGAQRDTLWHLTNVKRWPEITSSTPISATKTSIKSFFGGLLYVDVMQNINLGPFEITVEGATVLAPHFVHGVNTDAEWNTVIKNYPAPYGEIESNQLIVTVERAYLQAVTTPSSVARHLSDVVDTEDWLAGKNMTHKERVVVDIHIALGYLHSGYPVMGYNDVYIQNSLTVDRTPIVDGGAVVNVGQWGLYAYHFFN